MHHGSIVKMKIHKLSEKKWRKKFQDLNQAEVELTLKTQSIKEKN